MVVCVCVCTRWGLTQVTVSYHAVCVPITTLSFFKDLGYNNRVQSGTPQCIQPVTRGHSRAFLRFNDAQPHTRPPPFPPPPHTHTYTHTHTHTYTFTLTHIHIDAYTQYLNMHARTRIHTYTHVYYIHTQLNSLAHKTQTPASTHSPM